MHLIKNPSIPPCLVRCTQSAAKTKERRMQHANELEHKLAAAQEEYDSVANHVEELRVDNNTLTQYNDELVATVRMFDCLQTQKPTIICW